MGAPAHAYPIGKPTRDSKDPSQIAKLKEIPDFVCQCGHRGLGEHLLGVDDEETMWCPVCRNATWTWGVSDYEVSKLGTPEQKKYWGF